MEVRGRRPHLSANFSMEVLRHTSLLRRRRLPWVSVFHTQAPSVLLSEAQMVHSPSQPVPSTVVRRVRYRTSVQPIPSPQPQVSSSLLRGMWASAPPHRLPIFLSVISLSRDQLPHSSTLQALPILHSLMCWLMA